MSWLSHFTGWVGEKKNTLLPIITGLAGFAAGMLPGVGGTAQKLIDGLGNKISGGSEMLNQVNNIVASDPVSPLSPAIASVQVPQSPTIAPPEQVGGIFDRKSSPVADKEGVNPLLYVAGGLLAFMMLGNSSRR